MACSGMFKFRKSRPYGRFFGLIAIKNKTQSLFTAGLKIPNRMFFFRNTDYNKPKFKSPTTIESLYFSPKSVYFLYKSLDNYRSLCNKLKN